MRAILTYHSIDDSGSPISVSPAAFRAHCRFLAAGRVRVLSLEGLMADAQPDAVALTFDDGFENTGSVAWPILESFGLSATVFVVPGHVGGHNDWGGRRAGGIPHLPLLSWDGLARLEERGATLGAHTMTHANLAVLPAAAVEDELAESNREMHTRTGRVPRTFAYPYGEVAAPAAAAVRRTYALGVTTELRGLAPNDDPALLPRLDMYYLRAPGALEAWGRPAFRARLWVAQAGRRTRRWVAPYLGKVS